MASTGLTFPTSGANVSGIYPDWNFPGRITANDASETDVVLDATANSDLLCASGFGFSLPTGATIEGFVLEADIGVMDGPDPFLNAYITKDGANPEGTGKSFNVAGTLSVGGASDMWGVVSITEAEVEASTFGVVLQFDSTNTSTCTIDYVRLNVYYGAAPLTDEPSVLRIASSGLRW